MQYVSHRRLVQDVREWSQRLPDDLSAVAGIPRSGVLPAALLALERNLPLLTLEQVASGERTATLRRGGAVRGDGPVLVLDDSLHSGRTLADVRRDLAGIRGVLFGAVYVLPEREGTVDVHCRVVPRPRVFEWNLFHCAKTEQVCVDLDGVLCADWTDREEDSGPGLARYLEHLRGAPVLRRPSYPVHAVVTSRLEKYRPETEAWLERHGIRCGRLAMSPHPTAAARRSARDHAHRKAEVYSQSTEALLFVESDPGQAREIRRRSGKPVLCTESMELVDP